MMNLSKQHRRNHKNGRAFSLGKPSSLLESHLLQFLHTHACKQTAEPFRILMSEMKIKPLVVFQVTARKAPHTFASTRQVADVHVTNSNRWFYNKPFGPRWLYGSSHECFVQWPRSRLPSICKCHENKDCAAPFLVDHLLPLSYRPTPALLQGLAHHSGHITDTLQAHYRHRHITVG